MTGRMESWYGHVANEFKVTHNTDEDHGIRQLATLALSQGS